MNRSSLLHVAPLAILATLAPSLSFAEPAATANAQVSDDDNTRARALFRKGVAAFGEGKNEEADKALTEAWTLRQTYDVAAALAQAEIALGHYRDAAEHLDFCLNHFAPVESEQTLQQIRTAFADVKTHVAALKIAVDRDGAEVQVDGRSVGRTPLQTAAFVDAGAHTIAVNLNGDNVTRSVQTESGREYPVALKLGATTTALPTEHPAPPGGSGANDSGGEGRSLVPVVVGGALFVVGVGTAIGFALASSSKSDAASSLRDRVGRSGCADGTASAGDCTALQDALSAKDRDRNWSTAGIVLAGVAVVATPTYWFLWPHSSPTRESRSRGVGFRASANPAGANVWISGQF
ncbi:MAG TPA: PEGA domain-containing protein [Polyangiaceae bacterium]|jgi:hypothetical protein|nr:PEGA domain-containing protein [Polyangiaceae bacterium]